MKSNLITQKEKQKFKEQERKKKAFIKGQNYCYLCGDQINTYLEKSSKSYFIVEKAQCKNCRTLIRVKNHSLQ